ncbi:hypothetical protein B0H13DRAFT_1983210 [Mycena leptocephala]|nr:hypothetical protein B0H13DRAFT_2001184 [Mycena leptocephala]KAJ7922477.1 hypothetical protein B0H13DRAFT_1983210 [Mycena leptocephala]
MSAADFQGQLYVFKSTLAYLSPTASSRIAGSFDIWPFTLLVYEFFLTLEWEISRYWGDAFTLTVPNVLCQNLESYHQYFIVATQVLVGVMLILRTYALYERSKRVLALMLTVAVVTVAVGIWSVVTSTSDDSSINPYFGCTFPTSRSEGTSLAVAWAGVTIFDSTVFLLTLFRVLFGRHRDSGMDLFTVLLRDGVAFPSAPPVMVMSNIANIITLVAYSRGIATTFTNIISSIMITRLMLNLRDPELAHMSGRLPQSQTTTGNNWFAGDTAAGGSPVLDTNLDIELPERRAGPSDSRTLGG